MADLKISELGAITAVASADVLPIVDTSLSETNKVSVEDLLRSAPAGTAAAPSIAFVDDPDTGFYRSAANELSISTGGTQRVVVDAAGNVGIGTSSPSFPLTVSSTNATVCRLANSSSTTAFLTLEANNTTQPPGMGASAQDLVFNTAFTERMRINSTGNVGIGTSNPTGSLHVARTGETAVIKADRADASVAGSISLAAGSTTNSITNTGTKSFFIATDNTERMRIDASGHILAGTTSSTNIAGTTNKIQVFSSDWSESAVSLVSTSNDSYGPRICFGKSFNGGLVQNNHIIGGFRFAGYDGTDYQSRAAEILCAVDGTPGLNDMPGRLVFSTTADGASSPTERMRITSAGNVGIGTSSPSYRLDVLGGAENTYLRVGVNSTDSHQCGLLFGEIGAAAPGQVVYSHINDSLRFITNSAEHMRIDSAGNVGIGATSPGEKLEVNGTIKATDINFTGLATYADDTAAGTGGLVAGDVYKTSTGELRIKL